jgi:multidrug efflux system membrane fusion protein
LSAALLLAAAAVAAPGCSNSGAADPAAAGAGGRGGGRGGGGAAVVTTDVSVEKPMAVNIRVVGNVEAASTVGIRAQVTGELKTVEFTEGQDVTAGQLLFTLDPRPFELSLLQAQAALARDTANGANANAQLTRSVEMLAKGLVSRATHDATVAQADSLKSSIAADQVAIDNAKLQLQYTRITAPVSGRTGALLVHIGSLVRNNDTTPLVVINQVAPVFVSFAVPARLLDQLRGERTREGLRVQAAPAGTSDAPATGTVTFLDNSVDQATDTIRLKASFPNRDRRLWPGAFVDVTLRLAENTKAIVVPNAAVQASQQGQIIYVVKPDHTVEARPVTVDWTEGNESVIAKGLKVGETVVTDGQLRLTPGARVTTASAQPERGGH